MINFSSLRRITSSGNFIPEIDGLRFLAIAMVMLFHLDGFLMKELRGNYIDAVTDYQWLHSIFQYGYFGVEIFFCISAFVVALPFAKFYLSNGPKISLKNYFLRRITRIEPPYLISLFLMLLTHLYILNGERFSDYLPSFYYSLAYAHGFFYHRDFQPLVNNVTWSLEIEVQFYILAPIFFYLFFKKENYRLYILLACTLFVSILSKFPKPNTISLFEYFHYFLLGISLAYMKASKIQWSILEKINDKYSQTFISILAFFAMIITDITFTGPLATWFKIILSSLQMFFLFVVFYNLLLSEHKKIWINKPFVTLLGGMCYSIYLLHNQLIMSIGHLLLKIGWTKYFILDYFLLLIILLISVLLVSSLFYLLIERPCMDKNWPKKLLNLMSSKSNGQGII
ncbi:MAG: acyltransferase [Saprospiraceae bacterium]